MLVAHLGSRMSPYAAVIHSEQRRCDDADNTAKPIASVDRRLSTVEQHHHQPKQERIFNLSILLVCGTGEASRVESN